MSVRLVVSLAPTLVKHPVVLDLHSIPIDAFNLCGVVTDLKSMVVPNSIGTVFGA